MVRLPRHALWVHKALGGDYSLDRVFREIIVRRRYKAEGSRGDGQLLALVLIFGLL